ncbi:MAG: ACT domain-containing protein [Acidimicrobiia bacterium]|nr:ACT domain-containing protein [Acidimicrobiia bacterium]
MAHELSITAIGADRPGVVAGVTGALAALDANLEDTSMTILGGRFAMVLIVEVPEEVDVAAVEVALAFPASELHLDISVHPSDPTGASSEGERWSVSVYGADRPGIVHRFALALADARVNITDLATRVIGDPARPVYAMLLDVVIPEDVDAATVESQLRAIAGELEVECSMHAADADIL